MTKLSVNINKLATLRNARGHSNPNVFAWAKKIEAWGVHGITVHPRPDERHIRKADVLELSGNLNIELNIEGYPSEEFCKMILNIQPDCVTLVPDKPGQLTSDHGWNTIRNQLKLTDIILEFKEIGIRTSLFLDPNPEMVSAAAKTGADRIELYTESYAKAHAAHKHHHVIGDFIETAKLANEMGIGVNAGHDLDLNNLPYFLEKVPNVLEVSIGHALICDALELGMEQTIKKYLEVVK
jgi:pyridoxine 5-phosphate synthase